MMGLPPTLKHSLLLATLDASLDGILLVDHKTRKVLHYNPRFLTLWGIPHELGDQKDDKKLIQFVLSQLASPEQFLDLVEELYEHPERLSSDELAFKDGRVFQRHSEPLVVEGKVIARVWFFRDISELKIAQVAATTRADELRDLFDNLSEGVVVRDAEGRIVQSNASTFEILGVTAEDLQGSATFGSGVAVLHEDLSECRPEDYPSTVARQTGRQQKDITLVLRRPDGAMRWIQTTATPIFKDAALHQILITFRNITDKFLAARELKEAEAKLVFSSKMSSLGEMAGGIAHEINNPLAIIRGKATQLRRALGSGQIEPGQADAELTKIEATTDRIDRIIKGLQLFSRNAEGDPMETAPVARIVDGTLELCRESLKHRSIELTVGCEADVPIRCRPAQISQIVMNLVSNAQNAIEGLAEKWIAIDVASRGGTVVLSVTDSGHGIRAELVEKIMQPFFTTKEPGKGTGLGLSISKGIAEDHHGRLFYDPSCANTRFVLELPRA